MFAGATFLVSTAVRPQTCCVLTQHGASVVDECSNNVTHALVADDEDMPTAQWAMTSSALTNTSNGNNNSSSSSSLAARVAARLRGLRVPVLRESWVYARVCADKQQHIANNNNNNNNNTVVADLLLANVHDAHVVYNPLLFAGVVFTTTQLPRHVKSNVIACMLFYGAHYDACLTTATTLVVYGRLLCSTRSRGSYSTNAAAATAMSTSHTPAVCNDDNDDDDDDDGDDDDEDTSAAATVAATATRTSQKLTAARARGVVCVTVSWLQACLARGRLLPLPRPHNTTAAIQQRQEQQQRLVGNNGTGASHTPRGVHQRRRMRNDDGDDNDDAEATQRTMATPTRLRTCADAATLHARLDDVLEQLVLPSGAHAHM